MSLEHILLGMLSKPASGYDLRADFEQNGRHFWAAELSQIYPTLQKLQRKGWLKSRSVPSTKGPPRRVYERTPKGTAALHQWLKGEPILGTERFAYIAQLIFLGELGDWKRTSTFLKQLHDKLAAHGAFLAQAADDLILSGDASVAKLDTQSFHDWISLQIGVKSLEAKAQWCAQALKLAEDRMSREKRHE